MTRMTCETRDGQLYLVGVIDATAKLLEIPGRAVNGKLVLDLAGITFITPARRALRACSCDPAR
jgi:hypothetical protein